MNAHVSVPLLKSTVLADKVKVFTTDDDGSLHLHLAHDSGQNSSTNRYSASERTFFIDVVAGDCLE